MKSIFTKGLHAKAREVGKWPNEAVVHTVQVLGEGDDPQVLLMGDVPLGVKKNGFPKFPPKKLCHEFKAVIRLSEYRQVYADDMAETFPRTESGDDMSPKQGTILRKLSARGPEGTITLTECVELVGGNVYYNKAKHTGVVLANMVKRGMIRRIKPGLYGPIVDRGKPLAAPRADWKEFHDSFKLEP